MRAIGAAALSTARAHIPGSTAVNIPVISIGVPTVIRFEEDDNLFVTPREIDAIVKRASSLIAMGVNCAIHPEVEPELFLALS